MHKAEQVERYREAMGDDAARRQQALIGATYHCCGRPIDQSHAPGCVELRNRYQCCGASIFGPHSSDCPLGWAETGNMIHDHIERESVPDLDEPFYREEYR